MKAKAKNTKPGKKNKGGKKRTSPAETPKEEEEEVKETGVISDGVLDAFEETAAVDPLVDPLLVDDEGTVDGDDDQDEEDLDYNPAEW